MPFSTICTKRFVLRELSEKDATQRYLAWLNNPEAASFLVTAGTTQQLSDLREYVAKRMGRQDVLFLGIFERFGARHIGNIKYEPVDSETGVATMGILIGEPEYRGKGVAVEVLRASAEWLNKYRGIKEIRLGVSKDNVSAIKSYEKVGFLIADTPIPWPIPDAIVMIWRL